MYKHIGKKIKFFAIFCFILALVAAISVGVVMILVGITVKTPSVINIADQYQITVTGGVSYIIGGAMTILVGFLLAWISSWYTYGMGQMIENTDSMVEMQNEMINRLGGILQQQQQEISVLQQTASEITEALQNVPAPAAVEAAEEVENDDLVVSPIEE